MLVVFPTRGSAIQFGVPRGLGEDSITAHQVEPWVDVLVPDEETRRQAEAFISGMRYCMMPRSEETRVAVRRNLSNT